MVSKLEQVVIVIGASFKTMATVTVGQFIGNKQIKESVNVMKKGLKLVLIPTILIVLVIFVFPKQFCEIFVSSEDVVKMSVTYLSVVGISYILMPLRQLLYGFIVGTGHTKYVLFSAIISSIGEITTIVLLKDNNMENLIIIGTAILVYVAIEMCLNGTYYLLKKWQKVAL